jgi:hypothetical protein
MKLVASAFVVLGLAFLGACSGESKIGEECDEAGQTDDVCESGGVCGKNTSGPLVCLKQCTEQAGCAADEECNGVEGSSLKGCRSKSGASGAKK